MLDPLTERRIRLNIANHPPGCFCCADTRAMLQEIDAIREGVRSLVKWAPPLRDDWQGLIESIRMKLAENADQITTLIKGV